MNRRTSVILTLLALMLASCGTSPPVHYYSLEPTLEFSANDGPDAVIVGMGPLRLPDYLKRTRMVTRGSGSEVKVHEQARWAEPVNDAIHRVLAANVDSRLNDTILVAYPYLETVKVEYAVVGQVERFDADEQGQVVLDVQWAVLDTKRDALISPQRARYQSRASRHDDPNAIAGAMNEALSQFSEDIADQLGAAMAHKEN